MLVISLVLSDSPTLICSRLCLSTPHLMPTVSGLQPMKFRTLSIQFSELVPVLIPSVVTSRPTIASRPSDPLNLFFLDSQIRILLTIVRVYIAYFLTFLLTMYRQPGSQDTAVAGYLHREGCKLSFSLTMIYRTHGLVSSRLLVRVKALQQFSQLLL